MPVGGTAQYTGAGPAKKKKKPSPLKPYDPRTETGKKSTATSKVGKPHATTWTKKRASTKVKRGSTKAKKGDTLTKIAEEHNVSVRTLLLANPELKTLRAGTVVNLPKKAASPIGGTAQYTGAGKAEVVAPYTSRGATRRVTEFGPKPIPTGQNYRQVPVVRFTSGQTVPWNVGVQGRDFYKPQATGLRPDVGNIARLTGANMGGARFAPGAGTTAGAMPQQAAATQSDGTRAGFTGGGYVPTQGGWREVNPDLMAEQHLVNIANGNFPLFMTPTEFQFAANIAASAGASDLIAFLDANYQQDRYGNYVLIGGGEMPGDEAGGSDGYSRGFSGGSYYGGYGGYGGGGGGGYGARGQEGYTGFRRGSYSPETGAELQRGGRAYFNDFGPVTWRI